MENEALTTHHRKRALVEALLAHAPDDEIRRVVLNELYGVAKSVVESCPLAEALDARGRPRDLARLLRRSRGLDSIVLLFDVLEHPRPPAADRADVLREWLVEEVRRCFDVVVQDVVRGSDALRLTDVHEQLERVTGLLGPDVAELAAKLAAHPEQRPRRPQGLKRSQPTEQLLRRSLLR